MHAPANAVNPCQQLLPARHVLLAQLRSRCQCQITSMQSLANCTLSSENRTAPHPTRKLVLSGLPHSATCTIPPQSTPSRHCFEVLIF